MDWQKNLITDIEGVREILRDAKRVAVLGIKPEIHADRAAHYVPEYLQSAGYDIVPVPVYYPEVEHILGQPVFRRLQDIPGNVDLVNVFRRPKDLAPHLDDILAKRPSAVWLQLGIRDDAFAAALVAQGIDVVQDRCILVDHRRLLAAG